MLDNKSKELLYFKVPVFITDAAIHLMVFCGSLHWTHSELLRFIRVGDYGVYGLLLIAFACSIAIFRIRLHERKIRLGRVLWRAIEQTVVTYVLFIALLAMVYKAIPRTTIVVTMLTAIPMIAVWHYVVNRLVRSLRRMGRNTRRVVIIGADEVARMLYDELCVGQAMTGYRVIGYFSSLAEPLMPTEAPRLGTIENFFTWIAGKDYINEIYCSLPPATCEEQVDRIIKVCNDRFIDFFYVPTMDGYPKRDMQISKFGRVSVIRLREEPMNSIRCKVFKRSFDILISGLFLCTVYPFVCLFVWLGNFFGGNRGDLYFRQERTGYNGENFRMYKFRSMKPNADADRLQATKDDPRKTPFGDFLRRSSIDELPQFINVFRGEMSIIGPRPHMLYHTEMYSRLIGDYMVRHLAKPGITGWAQVNGCRGETRTDEEMRARVEHDIWYIEHWTPMIDVEIFFRTFWQLLPGHDKQAY